MNSLIIQDMTEDQLKNFELLVANDIKNLSSQDNLQFLKTNLDLWLYFLLTMKRTAEYNVSSRNSNRKITLTRMRADEVSQSEIDNFISTEEKWKVNTIKFLSVVERRILYVNLLAKQAL
jgi:hypothetical protein